MVRVPLAEQTKRWTASSEKKKAAPEKTAKGNRKKADEKDEPSILFSICACLALILILFTVYIMSAQYFNDWHGQQLPLVGFEQIKSSMNH